MKLVSMKMSKAEAKAETDGMPKSSEPRYPFGLEIRLGRDELEKLALDDPDVGMEVTIEARGVITMYRESERQGQKPDCSAEIQITDIAIGEAPAAKKAASAATHLDKISRPTSGEY